MPRVAESAEVLGGLARVVSFARDPAAYYLRVYFSDKKDYRHTRIEGAASLEAAQLLAPGVYKQFVQPGSSVLPKRGTRLGTKLRPRKNTIKEYAEQFLRLQDQRVVAGEIKEVTAKGKREAIGGHLLAFCELHSVITPADITIDTFKVYPAYRAGTTTQTKKKEIAIIREFLSFLNDRDVLKPKVAAKLDSLFPLIRRTGEDRTANPPITDRDWKLIQVALELRCDAVRSHPNKRNYYSRRMVQCLFKFLYASGMRPVEARGLRWKDIEFVQEGFTYYHGEDGPNPTRISEGEYQKMNEAVERGAVLDLVAVPNEIVVARVLRSKNKVVREVPSDSAELLKRWRLLQEECAGAPLNGDSLIFSVPDSRGNTPPFSQNSLNITWRAIIDSLGPRLQGPELSSRQYTPYSLRHSRAIFLIDHGVGAYEAAKMLGHTVQTFEQHYAPYLSRKRGAELVVAMGEKVKRD
jgi:integrase